MIYQTCDDIIMICCHDSNLLSLIKDVKDDVGAAVQHDPRFSGLLDVLEQWSVVAPRTSLQLSHRNLHILVMRRKFQDFLQFDQTFAFLVQNEELGPFHGLHQRHIGLD